MRKRVTAMMVTALALVATGCVQRTIKITSEPSGALVHLNDEAVGRTPVTVPFTFYGTYDVRLDKEGYEPLWTSREAQAPFWEYPGPDLIAEAVPGAKVQLDWHFDLAPQPAPAAIDADRLLDHAQQMRTLTEKQ